MPHQCTGCGHVFPDGSKEMLSGCPDCGGNKFQFQPSGATDGASGGGTAAEGDAAAGGTAPDPSDEPPEPPEPPSPGGSVAETVAGAAQRVRNVVGSDEGGRARSPIAADEGSGDHEWPAVGREGAGTEQQSEDAAQAGARSATVSPDELPDHDVERNLPEPDAGDAPTPDGSEPAGTVDADAPSAAGASEDDPGSAPFTGSGDREEQSPDLSELRAELNDQFESIKIVERGQYELNLMELYDREEYIISLMEDGRYAIEVPETWRGES